MPEGLRLSAREGRDEDLEGRKLERPEGRDDGSGELGSILGKFEENLVW
jgi:hypothetical protein